MFRNIVNYTFYFFIINVTVNHTNDVAAADRSAYVRVLEVDGGGVRGNVIRLRCNMCYRLL